MLVVESVWRGMAWRGDGTMNGGGDVGGAGGGVHVCGGGVHVCGGGVYVCGRSVVPQ